MGKERLTLLKYLAAGAALALALCAAAPTGASTLSLTTAYAVDPLTGAALEGYDAVSYFTESAPLTGRPEFEYYWSGVPWYFATAANRDVFIKSPETYVPMFGGYAAMSMARGYLSTGNPRIYAILAGRLFLFYSSGNKDAFLISPRDAYQRAQEEWAVLSKDAGF
ncbi:MAG: hypothetical protein KKH72_05655 [Alphaproteobacteria bacterium]|nr:hypothetical protein [Alphaproteobacteria bacterium]